MSETPLYPQHYNLINGLPPTTSSDHSQAYDYSQKFQNTKISPSNGISTPSSLSSRDSSPLLRHSDFSNISTQIPASQLPPSMQSRPSTLINNTPPPSIGANKGVKNILLAQPMESSSQNILLASTLNANTPSLINNSPQFVNPQVQLFNSKSSSASYNSPSNMVTSNVQSSEQQNYFKSEANEIQQPSINITQNFETNPSGLHSMQSNQSGESCQLETFSPIKLEEYKSQPLLAERESPKTNNDNQHKTEKFNPTTSHNSSLILNSNVQSNAEITSFASNIISQSVASCTNNNSKNMNSNKLFTTAPLNLSSSLQQKTNTTNESSNTLINKEKIENNKTIASNQFDNILLSTPSLSAGSKNLSGPVSTTNNEMARSEFQGVNTFSMPLSSKDLPENKMNPLIPPPINSQSLTPNQISDINSKNREINILPQAMPQKVQLNRAPIGTDNHGSSSQQSGSIQENRTLNPPPQLRNAPPAVMANQDFVNQPQFNLPHSTLPQNNKISSQVGHQQFQLNPISINKNSPKLNEASQPPLNNSQTPLINNFSSNQIPLSNIQSSSAQSLFPSQPFYSTHQIPPKVADQNANPQFAGSINNSNIPQSQNLLNNQNVPPSNYNMPSIPPSSGMINPLNRPNYTQSIPQMHHDRSTNPVYQHPSTNLLNKQQIGNQNSPLARRYPSQPAYQQFSSQQQIIGNQSQMQTQSNIIPPMQQKSIIVGPQSPIQQPPNQNYPQSHQQSFQNIDYRQQTTNVQSPINHYQQNNYQNLNQQFGNLNVTQTGFNRLWGGENYDLLQVRNILPTEKIEAPSVRLKPETLDAANCHPE